jgi:putative membrane protein
VPEPDYRYSLANERTALAWVRTSLALLAGGIGVTSLARVAGLPRAVDVLSALICLLGGSVGVSALRTYQSRDRAMREGQPLPSAPMLSVVAGAIAVMAVLTAAYFVASAF